MKTTLDLPEHLLRQARQRALQQGCSLKDLVAECIRPGPHGGPTLSASISSAVVSLDPKELPVFRAQDPGALPAIDLAAALELEQQCLRREDRCRAGLSA